jgi:DNA polymerase V
LEIYSVDEAFLDLDAWSNDSLVERGRNLVRHIRRSTGIPTSLGIAKTKTLAKVAARFAKKYHGYHSVCYIDDEEKRRKALQLTDIADVWGIGRRLRPKLNNIGIETAAQFADLSEIDVHKIMNIIGERTWRELNGEPCITLEQEEPLRKQICSSRSFGKLITTYDELAQSISLFATIVTRKLREQGLAAVSVSVFIHTNAFRKDLPQYFNSSNRKLLEPSNDTMTVSKVACECLRSIFREGFQYKKAGIMITEVTDERHIQTSLFAQPGDREKRRKLMAVLDDINATSVAHDRVHIASYRAVNEFIKCDNKSPLYTTHFSDIITINCNNG